MESNNKRVQELIRKVRDHLLHQLKLNEDGTLRFIDPNDKEEISAHYAVSHLAAGLIMLGNKDNGNKYYSTGKQLLTGLLDRWVTEHLLPAYHFDFNNFALVLCYDHLIEDELKEQIKDIILKSPDSPHDTINWLPMRIFVNYRRFEWTGDLKYQKRMRRCEELINQATNSDGGIEDRIPKGVSFNLQYDISTLATICHIKKFIPKYDVNVGLNFLLRNIAPDGDINYQGRGCNQIFAWGPWLYILSTFGLSEELEKALDYLETRLPNMLKNDNMMLNDWPGSEKYLWWDYHHASVYSSHFLLWLVLAIKDTYRLSNLFGYHNLDNNETGLTNIRNEDFFICIFEGRNEYLAEYGPSINLIWTKRNGNIFKGIFAPWRGLFGNKNTLEEVALMNFFGLFSLERHGGNILLNRIYQKFHFNRRSEIKAVKKPIFCPIKIEHDDHSISLSWIMENHVEAFANIPVFCDIPSIELNVDEKKYPLTLIGKFRNQYDWLYLRQSKPITGRIWKITLPIK